MCQSSSGRRQSGEDFSIEKKLQWCSLLFHKWRNTLQLWYSWCYCSIHTNLFRNRHCLLEGPVASPCPLEHTHTPVAASCSSEDADWSSTWFAGHIYYLKPHEMGLCMICNPPEILWHRENPSAEQDTTQFLFTSLDSTGNEGFSTTLKAALLGADPKQPLH